jgi:hypothetical protein
VFAHSPKDDSGVKAALYEVKSDGRLGVAVATTSDMDPRWNGITAGQFYPSAKNELLFFDPVARLARVVTLRVTGSDLGFLHLAGRTFDRSWSNIVVADLADSQVVDDFCDSCTEILAYDSMTGEAQAYEVYRNGLFERRSYDLAPAMQLVSGALDVPRTVMTYKRWGHPAAPIVKPTLPILKGTTKVLDRRLP